jgi:hypothetical protein
LRVEEGPGTFVEVDIGAPVITVWGLVTNIIIPSRFSAEFLEAEWDNHERGVATFHKRNQHLTPAESTVRCFVDVSDEPRLFGWRTGDPKSPDARWRFELVDRHDRSAG